MKRIGIYCLDQDRRYTSSIGIFNYTHQLIKNIARLSNPGLKVSLVLSSANKDDLIPPDMPDWMDVVEIKGSFQSGINRLRADNIIAATLPKKLNLDLIHFPKGWLPINFGFGVKRIVTIHDTIVQYYLKNHPRIAPLKMRYFNFLSKYSLTHADLILTVSKSSAADLKVLNPMAADKIRIVVEGTGIDVIPSQSRNREGILIYGSKLPHKATQEALALVDKWFELRGHRMHVTVMGIDGWQNGWGTPPRNLDPVYTGRVSNDTVCELLSSHSVLVILSHIEGFGLPALEAYTCGTPVCFRNRSGIGEILSGVPGGWDGSNLQDFIEAIEAAFNMSGKEIHVIRNALTNRYNWEKGTEQTLTAYREILES